MKVLVTGISGLGGHLAPYLVAAGHDAIGFSRDTSRVAVDVPVIAGDAATGAGLDAEMRDVEVAYFMIHTYERGNREGFAARDRRVAHNFAAAAQKAGVRRIVFFGVPPVSDFARSSRHVDSRLEVEDILLEAVPGSVAVGAFTVVSPRSRSFRVMLDLLSKTPVVPLPPWRVNNTQPMDVRDVFDCLVAAGQLPTIDGHRIRIGGPEVMSWEVLLRRLSAEMQLHRRFISIPGNPSKSMLRLLVTRNGGNAALMTPLLESLDAGDIVPGHQGTALLAITPRSAEQAIRHAVAEFRSDTWRETEGTPIGPGKVRLRRA